MSMRSGRFLHRGGRFLISRLQSAGVDNLNIPSEKVAELGNEISLATVYDTPDLSFGLESFDANCDIEAILTRVDPSTVIAGQAFDFKNARPLDIVSPWKGKYGTFLTTAGAIVPYLLVEQATYRAAIRQNFSKQFTLRGDSIYYCQKTPKFKYFAAAAVLAGGVGPYTFDFTAVPSIEQGVNVYAYCITLHHTDGTWSRLVHGDDYTDTTAGFTLAVAPAVTDTMDVVYATATQESDPQSIHPSTTTKPAAVRGRDIDLVISNIAATPTRVTWKGVQSVEATWRVTLDPDEELGNIHYVDRDYDVPEVTGNIVLRPVDAQALMTKLAQLQGVASTTQTLNTSGFVPMDIEIQVNHPDTGARLETINVPDARFQPPPVAPRVGQKADFTLPFTSDGGQMVVYSGAKP